MMLAEMEATTRMRMRMRMGVKVRAYGTVLKISKATV